MIEGIDHIVLTVADIERTAAFYKNALGIEDEIFGDGRRALKLGNQKINLHTLGMETRNRATIGSGDLCLLTREPLDRIVERLVECEVAVIEGPVARTGAKGPMISVYFNDPDGNLVEVSRYD